MGADISTIAASVPERAGNVEVGKIKKRNVIFGGITWVPRFLAITGHNLNVLKPRLVGSGYSLVGTFDLLRTRVTKEPDEHDDGATARGEVRCIKLEARVDGHGDYRLWMRLRASDDRECNEWARALRQATKPANAHQIGMERIHDALLRNGSPEERRPSSAGGGGDDDESKDESKSAVADASAAASAAAGAGAAAETHDKCKQGAGGAVGPIPFMARQVSYTIMDDEELSVQQTRTLLDARAALPSHLTEGAVRTLLAHFKWDTALLAEAWASEGGPRQLEEELHLALFTTREGDLQRDSDDEDEGAAEDDKAGEPPRGSSAKSLIDAALSKGSTPSAQPATSDGGAAEAKEAKDVTEQQQDKKEEEEKEAEEEEEDCCDICYGDWPRRDFLQLSCGHRFCKNCWKGHLTAQLTNGREAAMQASCMMDKCMVAVTDELYHICLPAREWDKVLNYRKQAFVEQNDAVRWCINPKCEAAIYWKRSHVSRNIECRCGAKFCFSCGKTPGHYPATCMQFDAWEEKHKKQDGESKLKAQQQKWFEENTKPCPGCKNPIEKNKGCNHMTCYKCKHDFCWICLGPWSTHGSQTGGYYQCNVFDDKAYKKRMKELRTQEFTGDRYTHYMRRSTAHENSGGHAATLIAKVLRNRSTASGLDLSYLIATTERVVEMREVLRWSYVFGFYLGEGIHCDYFEGLQGLLEADTEQLHELAEAPILMVDKRSVLPFPSDEALAAHKAKVAKKLELVNRTHDEFKEAIEDLLGSGVRTAPKGTGSKEPAADPEAGGGAAAAPAPSAHPTAADDRSSSGRFMGKLQSFWARVKDRGSSSSDAEASAGGGFFGLGRPNVQRWQCVLCNEWTEPPSRSKEKGADGSDELPRCRICDTPRIEGKFRERLAALQVCTLDTRPAASRSTLLRAPVALCSRGAPAATPAPLTTALPVCHHPARLRLAGDLCCEQRRAAHFGVQIRRRAGLPTVDRDEGTRGHKLAVAGGGHQLDPRAPRRHPSGIYAAAAPGIGRVARRRRRHCGGWRWGRERLAHARQQPLDVGMQRVHAAQRTQQPPLRGVPARHPALHRSSLSRMLFPVHVRLLRMYVLIPPANPRLLRFTGIFWHPKRVIISLRDKDISSVDPPPALYAYKRERC